MGQAEAKNWLKSTPSKTVTMRYAGEYKFAGGNIDAGETIEAAARRELEEEMLRPAGRTLPDTAILRPFSLKQTNPIRSRSNLMWNFVAIADENPWLQNLDIDGVNAYLEEKRVAFADLVKSGQFWSLTPEKKELVAPEVHAFAWIPLKRAVELTLSTMSESPPFVNEFQHAAFEQYSIKRRDPMFMTMAALLHLEAFPSAEVLKQFCDAQDKQAMLKQMQYLFTGMTDEDFRSAKLPDVPMVPTVARIRAERVERMQRA